MYRSDYKVHSKHLKNDIWPITYIEPDKSNLRLVGMDIANEANLYEAAMQARNSGKSIITAPVTTKSNGVQFMLLYAPFYEQILHDESKGRGDNFTGVVFTPIILDKLIYEIFQKQNRHLGIKIIDGNDVLYDEHIKSLKGYDPNPLFTKKTEVEVYGRKWVLDIRTKLSFKELYGNNHHIIVLISAIIINAMVLMLLFLRVRASQLSLELKSKQAEIEKYSNDIEQQKFEIEQKTFELEDAKMRAEDSSKLKSTFLTNISHEIQKPLQEVMSNISYILGRTELDLEQIKSLSNISKSVDSLMETLNDIVDVTNIDAEKFQIEPYPFDLLCLVEEVSGTASLKIPNNNVEVLIDYPPLLPRYLIGDSGKIGQIIIKLLTSFIDLIEQGSIIISVRVKEEVENKVRVFFEIKANDLEITEDELDFTFSKLRQTDQASSMNFEARGLGLSVCEKIVAMMNGNIGVEASLDDGGKFSFDILLEMVNKDLLNVSDIHSAALKSKKVLIIDRNKAGLNLLKEQLSYYGMVVYVTKNPKKALDELVKANSSKEPYDLLIVNHNMPKIDAKHICRDIRKEDDFNELSIVLTTSSPLQESNSKLKKMGFDALIKKPINPSILPNILKAVLASESQNEEEELITNNNVKEAISLKNNSTKLYDIKVLVVEDDRVNSMLAKNIIEKLGAEVKIADNGLEALKIYSKESFDIVFMDCQMPEMDGYEATIAIRKYEERNQLDKTPIISFIASSNQEDKERCVEAGMDGHLDKPFRSQMIEDLFYKYFENKG